MGIVSEVKNKDFPFVPGHEVVKIDPRYFRPAEVDLLIGDASKAKEKLGWEPRHTLQDMCGEMVRTDITLFRRDQLLKQAGFDVKNEFE